MLQLTAMHMQVDVGMLDLNMSTQVIAHMAVNILHISA